MDTSESMKSETPQPATKEQSPQKEQTENNAAGMSHLIAILFIFAHMHTVFFLSMHFERTAKQNKNIKQLTNAFASVFDCVELLFVFSFFLWPLNNHQSTFL